MALVKLRLRGTSKWQRRRRVKRAAPSGHTLNAPARPDFMHQLARAQPGELGALGSIVRRSRFFSCSFCNCFSHGRCWSHNGTSNCLMRCSGGGAPAGGWPGEGRRAC